MIAPAPAPNPNSFSLAPRWDRKILSPANPVEDSPPHLIISYQVAAALNNLLGIDLHKVDPNESTFVVDKMPVNHISRRTGTGFSDLDRWIDSLSLWDPMRN